jgi:penicillin-binding protein 2
LETGGKDVIDKDNELNYRRILMLFGIIFFVFGGLFVRLTMIQVMDYPKYSRWAATQRQNLLLKNVFRGSFFDRHGEVIRGTSEAWYLLIDKADLLRFEQITKKIESIITGNFVATCAKDKKQTFWIFPKPLNYDQITRINALHLPECKIIANYLRQDTNQGRAWHLLGLSNPEKGFSGLEYLYQNFLCSDRNYGSIFTLNDGKEGFFSGLGLRTQSIPNQSGVVLTIDAKIQDIIEKVMDHHQLSGAIVILGAQSGQILAMASRPQVDALNLDSRARVLESHPYVNRAISAYHPGSIFKLVTLSAGLDSGLLKPDEYFEDQGFYQIGAKRWLCTTSKNGHGVISLTQALAYSCNPIFIEITLRLQPQVILKYGDRFGFGQPCNIGLRDESWGGLPSGIGLSDGEIANLALGQQDVYTTPLQVASLIQTIANDGVRCVPQLVLGTSLQRGANIRPLPKNPFVRIMKAETAHIIKDMMAAVVDYGTGRAAQLTYGVAGKTGTAQANDEVDGPSHAWFAGFTPIKHPKYVAVIFCEQGISGAETAAPIFKEVMEKVTRIRD